MSAELLSVFLDVAVLVFLGFTIYYALKLSRSLNNFRAYRNEFDALMKDLNTHIEHAYEAVRAIKDSSNRSADDLEFLYKESRKMAEELKSINENSAKLAARLERAGSAKRGGIKREDDAFSDNVEPFEAADDLGFAIHDRELDMEDEEDFMDEDDPQAASFGSKAEKELYQALKKNKKSG